MNAFLAQLYVAGITIASKYVALRDKTILLYCLPDTESEQQEDSLFRIVPPSVPPSFVFRTEGLV